MSELDKIITATIWCVMFLCATAAWVAWLKYGKNQD